MTDARVYLSTLESGRLVVRAARFPRVPPDAIAHRLELYVGGSLLLSLPFTEDQAEDEEDEQPDREPSPEQERAWDLREDDARRGALDDDGFPWTHAGEHVAGQLPLPIMRTGAYGRPIPPGVCGVYFADEGGEWMCREPEGHGATEGTAHRAGPSGPVW